MVKSSIERMYVTQTKLLTNLKKEDFESLPKELVQFVEGFSTEAQKSFKVHVYINQNSEGSWSADIHIGIVLIRLESSVICEVCATFSGKFGKRLIYGDEVSEVVYWVRKNLIEVLEVHCTAPTMKQYLPVLEAEKKRMPVELHKV